MAHGRHPNVVFIVGATASGKTAAALRLAAALPIEIINADSRQVYRGMSIGTAKPTPQEQASVPHHLIDVAEPSDGYSLATFLSQARQAVADAAGKGALPVVVGGTGQYIWGLFEGWQVPEVAPQADIRARLECEAVELGADALHAKLAAVDEDAAALIDPRNVRRVVRALEVLEVTGERLSARKRKLPPPFNAVVVGLDVARSVLHVRIDARVERMLASGWLDEVRTLLDQGNGPELPAFSSAGYRDMAACVRGDLSLDEATARTKVATHRLARTQSTWFKRGDPRITWCTDVDALTRIAAESAAPR